MGEFDLTSVDMKTHIIRLAEDTDFHPIIDFLKREWNPQHIYVKNPNFFRYEHCIDGRINALIAIEKETWEPVSYTHLFMEEAGKNWSQKTFPRKCLKKLSLKDVE